MHFKTVNVNHDWMSSVDKKTGYGNIVMEDFVKLVETQGFRVDESKAITLHYKLNKDFVSGFVKNTILTSFPEIEGQEREEFFREYIHRADKLKHIVMIFSLKNLNFSLANSMIRIPMDTMTLAWEECRLLERKLERFVETETRQI